MFKSQYISSIILFRQFGRPKFLNICCQLSTDVSVKQKPAVKPAFRTKSTMFVEATVCEATALSPSVKGLMLKVDKSKFSFKPGQWVDLLVPGIKEVTGYSICSTPKLLEKKGMFELAIKYSDHSITDWLHKQCDVGSTVQVASGGDFCYDVAAAAGDNSLDVLTSRSSAAHRSLLLIAGGVGINPLISILRHVAELADSKRPTPDRVVLAYSAASADELVFRDDIIRLVNEHHNMSAEFYITQATDKTSMPVQEFPSVTFKKNTRIDMKQLARILDESFVSDRADIDCYVCGPLSLIDDTNSALLELGLAQHQIRYEKWW